MSSFLDAISDAVRTTACGIISVNDEINGFLEGVGLPGASDYADRTRALRRQLCDNDDDTVPVTQSQVTGGQCPGIEYRAGAPGVTTSSVSRGIGPLSVSTTTGENNGRPTWTLTFVWAGGLTGGSGVQSFFDDGPSPTISERYTGVVATRVDDQLDTCGDGPTPPIPPYVPTPITVNISYQNNQEITVNEDVDITIFSPQVNLIGGIFAPVVISGNTFQLIGTAKFSPEFKLEISPEVNIGTGGGNTDSPGPNPDRPYPEPTPNPSERRVIVGAVVTAVDVSTRQDFIPQDGNPDIAIPNLGFISFYIATENDRAWTADIPIKNVRTYIPCPVAGGAIDVAGTGRSGIELSVQPVWGYPGQQL